MALPAIQSVWTLGFFLHHACRSTEEAHREATNPRASLVQLASRTVDDSRLVNSALPLHPRALLCS